MTRQTDYAVTEVELAEWDGLLRQFDEATVFHTTSWISAVAQAEGLRMTLAQVRVNGTVLAIWPFLSMRKAVFKIIGSPLPGWSTPYLGPLFKPEVDVGAALAALFGHKLFRGYSYFACKVIDRAGAIDLGRFGFSQVLRYETFRLDVRKSEDELWSNLRRECRNHVRKGQKSNLEIREEVDGEFLKDYWAMTVETFARAQMKPTHSQKFVEELWSRLHPAGLVHALSAFHKGERVGTLMLLRDRGAMYYWGGASYLRFRNLSAHNLLQWEAICLAKRTGVPTYDFISTTGGPGKFKESFGPTAVAIATHWERSPSKLLMALKRRYERYLRGRQRVAAAPAGMNAEGADASSASEPVLSH